ncbi:41237_t:CDS:2, partial [Gigaspora margarita]
NNNGNTGFTLAIKKQSIFVKYGPTFHLKIADIAIGENHLGRRILMRKRNGLILIPVKISSRIKKIFAGGNHSFAIDENGMIFTWGQNAEGQCSIESPNPIITPMKLEFFKNLIRVNQISAGLYHMLVLLENGKVYSFSSSKYRQLGIDVSKENRKSPVKINLNNCNIIATGEHHSMAVNDENKVYIWGFGETYTLRNQSGNDKLLPFKLKYEEFGEIIEIDGGSQYSVILSSFCS